MQTVVHHRAKPFNGKYSIRLHARQKYLATFRSRPDFAEITQNRCPDFANEWIVLALSLLRATDVNDLPLPVDVIKAEVAHLAATQTINSDQQQHRMIANIGWSISSAGCEQPLDIAPLRPTRQVF
jgi:hypothetical protein